MSCIGYLPLDFVDYGRAPAVAGSAVHKVVPSCAAGAQQRPWTSRSRQGPAACAPKDAKRGDRLHGERAMQAQKRCGRPRHRRHRADAAPPATGRGEGVAVNPVKHEDDKIARALERQSRLGHRRGDLLAPARGLAGVVTRTPIMVIVVLVVLVVVVIRLGCGVIRRGHRWCRLRSRMAQANGRPQRHEQRQHVPKCGRASEHRSQWTSLTMIDPPPRARRAYLPRWRRAASPAAMMERNVSGDRAPPPAAVGC